MPTIDREPQLGASESHLARQMAESFGIDPDVTTGPGRATPKPWLTPSLAPVREPDVLDVGIGTGISARPFVAAGCRVHRRRGRRSGWPGSLNSVGSRLKWPSSRTGILGSGPSTRSIAGQTWHWVDPSQAPPRRRRCCVLAAGWRCSGMLPAPVNPVGGLRGCLPSSAARLPVLPWAPPGVLAAYARQHTKAADGIRAVRAFGEPEQWQFEWSAPTRANEWLDGVPTAGGHNLFPPAKLAELLAGIGAAIDAVGGSFAMGYTAVVVTAPCLGVPLEALSAQRENRRRAVCARRDRRRRTLSQTTGSYRWPTPWLNLESVSLVRIGTVEGKRRRGCLTAGKKHGQVYDGATFERALTTDAEQDAQGQRRRARCLAYLAFSTSYASDRIRNEQVSPCGLTGPPRSSGTGTPRLALTVPLVESPCAAIPEISTVR